MNELAGQLSEQQTDEDLKLYNFRQPKLLSKEVLKVLEKIHDLFIRHVKRIYSGILNHQVEVRLVNIEQVNFSGFLSEIESPASLYTFNVEELGDWCVINMDPAFCIYCVERQSGGFLQKPGEKRPLTRIEKNIMGNVIGKKLRELSHVWSSYIPFTIQHHIFESKPDNIRTISAQTPGIILHFSIDFEEASSSFSICYPYTTLKSRLMNELKDYDDSSIKKDLSSIEKKQFETDMKQVLVDLQVLLGKASVPLRKLARLQEGDVIALNQPIGEPLKIKINDKIKMLGYPGSLNGRKAIKIFDITKQPQDSF